VTRVALRGGFGRLGMGCRVLALLIGAVCWGATAQAGIFYIETFRGGDWVQTGNGNTLSLLDWSFGSNLFSVSPNDYNAVTMTYPGPGSPLSFSQLDPITFSYGSVFFATEAELNAAFPTGTYTFTASKGMTSDSTSFSYTTDYYPQSQPYFSGTTYQALQGMNAAAPFTLQFSPFVTGSLPSGSSSSIYVVIEDLTTSAVPFAGTYAASTASVVLPANTLTAGDSYVAALTYTNTILVPSPGTEFGSVGIYFGLGADLYFTAVPEPPTIVLLAPSCAFLAWLTLCRRRTRQTPASPLTTGPDPRTS
jgi:hypothetical protein